MNKKYLHIGSDFEFHGIKLTIIEDTSEKGTCKHCAGNDNNDLCYEYECVSMLREDDKNVIFKEKGG